MAYWLMKTEPYKFSWDDQCEKGNGRWEKRVRNYQARNNMQKMDIGDGILFYHSNEGKEIVGTLEVTGTAYPDEDDATGKFVTVDVKPVKGFDKSVTLKDIKAHPVLQNMQLVKQVRLSVSPVSDEEWGIIHDMAGAA